MRWLILAILLLVPADDRLSLLGRHPLTCPVCENNFTTVVSTQRNTRGGVDRDLFARALGPQPVYYHISTCPHCGYSGYVSDFDPGVSLAPDFRGRVQTEPGLELPEHFTPDRDPRELDAADRYRLALTCYRWRGMSDEAMGWLWLRASWVTRDKGSMLPREARLERVMSYIERFKPPLEPESNQADLELETATRVAEALVVGDFNRYQAPFVKSALALILRRHGENRHAKPILKGLNNAALPDELAGGLGRMLESIRQEHEQQREAARYFEQALLARRIPEENLGPACYLLGELLRRLGRDADAIPWFERALEVEKLPENLRVWARQQRDWCQYGQRHGVHPRHTSPGARTGKSCNENDTARRRPSGAWGMPSLPNLPESDS